MKNNCPKGTKLDINGNCSFSEYTSSSFRNAYGDGGYGGYGNLTSNTGNTGKSSGSGFGLDDIFGGIKTAADIYTTTEKTKQARAAAEIAAAQAAAERARAAQEAAKTEAASTVIDKIKAYSTPIAITGLFIIGGIVAYYFIRKKTSVPTTPVVKP